MSGFMFATCDRRFALGFLRHEYPTRDLQDTPESIGPLLDLVSEDLIRVQDPAYHQPCQIVQGQQYDSSRHAEIMETINRTLMHGGAA